MGNTGVKNHLFLLLLIFNWYHQVHGTSPVKLSLDLANTDGSLNQVSGTMQNFLSGVSIGPGQFVSMSITPPAGSSQAFLRTVLNAAKEVLSKVVPNAGMSFRTSASQDSSGNLSNIQLEITIGNAVGGGNEETSNNNNIPTSNQKTITLDLSTAGSNPLAIITQRLTMIFNQLRSILSSNQPIQITLDITPPRGSTQSYGSTIMGILRTLLQNLVPPGMASSIKASMQGISGGIISNLKIIITVTSSVTDGGNGGNQPGENIKIDLSKPGVDVPSALKGVLTTVVKNPSVSSHDENNPIKINLQITPPPTATKPLVQTITTTIKSILITLMPNSEISIRTSMSQNSFGIITNINVGITLIPSGTNPQNQVNFNLDLSKPGANLGQLITNLLPNIKPKVKPSLDDGEPVSLVLTLTPQPGTTDQFIPTATNNVVNLLRKILPNKMTVTANTSKDPTGKIVLIVLSINIEPDIESFTLDLTTPGNDLITLITNLIPKFKNSLNKEKPKGEPTSFNLKITPPTGTTTTFVQTKMNEILNFFKNNFPDNKLTVRSKITKNPQGNVLNINFIITLEPNPTGKEPNDRETVTVDLTKPQTNLMKIVTEILPTLREKIKNQQTKNEPVSFNLVITPPTGSDETFVKTTMNNILNVITLIFPTNEIDGKAGITKTPQGILSNVELTFTIHPNPKGKEPNPSINTIVDFNIPGTNLVQKILTILPHLKNKINEEHPKGNEVNFNIIVQPPKGTNDQFVTTTSQTLITELQKQFPNNKVTITAKPTKDPQGNIINIVFVLTVHPTPDKETDEPGHKEPGKLTMDLTNPEKNPIEIIYNILKQFKQKITENKETPKDQPISFDLNIIPPKDSKDDYVKIIQQKILTILSEIAPNDTFTINTKVTRDPSGNIKNILFIITVKPGNDTCKPTTGTITLDLTKPGTNIVETLFKIIPNIKEVVREKEPEGKTVNFDLNIVTPTGTTDQDIKTYIQSIITTFTKIFPDKKVVVKTKITKDPNGNIVNVDFDITLEPGTETSNESITNPSKETESVEILPTKPSSDEESFEITTPNPFERLILTPTPSITSSEEFITHKPKPSSSEEVFRPTPSVSSEERWTPSITSSEENITPKPRPSSSEEVFRPTPSVTSQERWTPSITSSEEIPHKPKPSSSEEVFRPTPSVTSQERWTPSITSSEEITHKPKPSSSEEVFRPTPSVTSQEKWTPSITSEEENITHKPKPSSSEEVFRPTSPYIASREELTPSITSSEENITPEQRPSSSEEVFRPTPSITSSEEVTQKPKEVIVDVSKPGTDLESVLTDQILPNIKPDIETENYKDKPSTFTFNIRPPTGTDHEFLENTKETLVELISKYFPDNTISITTQPKLDPQGNIIDIVILVTFKPSSRDKPKEANVDIDLTNPTITLEDQIASKLPDTVVVVKHDLNQGKPVTLKFKIVPPVGSREDYLRITAEKLLPILSKFFPSNKITVKTSASKNSQGFLIDMLLEIRIEPSETQQPKQENVDFDLSIPGRTLQDEVDRKLPEVVPTVNDNLNKGNPVTLNFNIKPPQGSNKNYLTIITESLIPILSKYFPNSKINVETSANQNPLGFLSDITLQITIQPSSRPSQNNVVVDISKPGSNLKTQVDQVLPTLVPKAKIDLDNGKPVTLNFNIKPPAGSTGSYLQVVTQSLIPILTTYFPNNEVSVKTSAQQNPNGFLVNMLLEITIQPSSNGGGGNPQPKGGNVNVDLSRPGTNLVGELTKVIPAIQPGINGNLNDGNPVSFDFNITPPRFSRDSYLSILTNQLLTLLKKQFPGTSVDIKTSAQKDAFGFLTNIVVTTSFKPTTTSIGPFTQKIDFDLTIPGNTLIGETNKIMPIVVPKVQGYLNQGNPITLHFNIIPPRRSVEYYLTTVKYQLMPILTKFFPFTHVNLEANAERDRNGYLLNINVVVNVTPLSKLGNGQETVDINLSIPGVTIYNTLYKILPNLAKNVHQKLHQGDSVTLTFRVVPPARTGHYYLTTVTNQIMPILSKFFPNNKISVQTASDQDVQGFLSDITVTVTISANVQTGGGIQLPTTGITLKLDLSQPGFPVVAQVTKMIPQVMGELVKQLATRQPAVLNFDITPPKFITKPWVTSTSNTISNVLKGMFPGNRIHIEAKADQQGYYVVDALVIITIYPM